MSMSVNIYNEYLFINSDLYVNSKLLFGLADRDSRANRKYANRKIPIAYSE